MIVSRRIRSFKRRIIHHLVWVGHDKLRAYPRDCTVWSNCVDYLSSFKFPLQGCNNLFRQPVNDTLWLGRTQVQYDMRCTFLNKGPHTIDGLSRIVIIDRPLDRAFDGFGVAPNSGTMPVEYLIFVTERINVATDKVPDIGILCHYTQR